MSRLTFAVALCALTVAPIAAPAQTVATVEEVTKELVTAARRNIDVGVKEPFSSTVASSAGGPILTYLAGQIANREAYETLTELLAVSAATQVGSTPDTGGSTSVAMKGLVPTILGFAVEHGAITQDVNDTVVTFRANPAGLVKALQGQGLLDIYADYQRQPGYRFTSRFSGSASFDTSLGDMPGTLRANEQQLTAWSVTAVLLNHRDPRSKGYATEWRALAKDQSRDLVQSRVDLDRALLTWPAFTAWQKALTDRVKHDVDEPLANDHNKEDATARFVSIVASELQALSELAKPDASMIAATSAYVGQLTTVVQARNDIYEFANKGAIATFDWTTTRDETLPDLYTLTGVYENAFTRSRKDDFTANVALRFYRKPPSGVDRQFKDFSLSAQWDRPLGRVAEIPFILTAAARYQYIPDDIPVSGVTLPQAADSALLAADPGTAIAPKGHLILGQAKLTVPLKAGVRMPLSVTFSNRTELIQEHDVRANFGITFDLDAVVAAVKAR